jgi:epoxyqueuosine reductase
MGAGGVSNWMPGGMNVSSEWRNLLEEHGYDGRIVATGCLSDLSAGIAGPRRRGELDARVYQRYMAGFSFQPPESLPAAQALIVVAVPQPQVQVTFEFEGAALHSVVPPTYLRWQQVDRQVGDLLVQALQPRGYRLAEASVPKKLLAVRSGLAAYGRNNIAYVPGMGSFHRLVAFYSDLPSEEDSWREPQMMQTCDKCTACLRRCPSGAITSDRFLLHAERCITFHNEKESAHPFPQWLDPSWHNWLVGCMHCQLVCPENREVAHRVKQGPVFTPNETALLLQGIAPDRLPAATARKLLQFDMFDIYEVLARNLRLLTENAAHRRPE